MAAPRTLVCTHSVGRLSHSYWGEHCRAARAHFRIFVQPLPWNVSEIFPDNYHIPGVVGGKLDYRHSMRTTLCVLRQRPQFLRCSTALLWPFLHYFVGRVFVTVRAFPSRRWRQHIIDRIVEWPLLRNGMRGREATELAISSGSQLVRGQEASNQSCVPSPPPTTRRHQRGSRFAGRHSCVPFHIGSQCNTLFK